MDQLTPNHTQEVTEITFSISENKSNSDTCEDDISVTVLYPGMEQINNTSSALHLDDTNSKASCVALDDDKKKEFMHRSGNRHDEDKVVGPMRELPNQCFDRPLSEMNSAYFNQHLNDPQSAATDPSYAQRHYPRLFGTNAEEDQFCEALGAGEHHFFFENVGQLKSNHCDSHVTPFDLYIAEDVVLVHTCSTIEQEDHGDIIPLSYLSMKASKEFHSKYLFEDFIQNSAWGRNVFDRTMEGYTIPNLCAEVELRIEALSNMECITCIARSFVDAEREPKIVFSLSILNRSGFISS